jgi:hypothetical protein
VHPVSHHSAAVQQPGFCQQERPYTDGADAPTVESPMADPIDQLAIATDIVHIAGAWDNQRVDRVSVERAHRLGRDTNAVRVVTRPPWTERTEHW